MADEIEPTPEPTDEPTAAFDAVPDEPTVTLDIAQLTPDQPLADPDIEVVVAEHAAPPRAPWAARRNQLIIGAAAAAVVVLIIVLVVVFSGGDDTVTRATVASTAPSKSSVSSSSTVTSAAATTMPPTSAVAPGALPTPSPSLQFAGEAFAFSPDGRRLATSSTGGPTVVRDVKSGAVVSTIAEPSGVLEFNSDGTVLLTVRNSTIGTGAYDLGPAHTWDAATGAPLAEMLADGFNRIGFSPDGRSVVGLSSGVVVTWDARTGAEGPSFSPERDLFLWAMSPDEQTLAVIWPGMLLDVSTGAVRATLDNPEDCNLGQPVFSPDGRWVAALATYCFGADPASVMVWDAATGRIALRLEDLCCENSGVTFSPDSRTIAVGPESSRNGDGIAVYEVPGGRTVALYTIPETVVAELPAGSNTTARAMGSEFSPDGRSLLVQFSLGNGPVTIVFDVASHEVVLRAWGLQNARFSPDGTMIAGVRALYTAMAAVELYEL
jgi:WD40 repeat protein